METQGIENAKPQVVVDANETSSIAALAAALAKAQGAMQAAAKDSKNPHFNSKYADLAAIWAACRAPLATNGLSVVQRVSTSGDGAVTVVTRLMHSSGEWIQDRCVFPVAQRTPQAYGSAVTYARRYALAALVGVAAEDDDGNDASGGPSRQEPPAKARKTEPEGKRETKAAASPEQAEKQLLATRVRRLWETAQKNGMTTEGFRTWAAGLLEEDKSSKEWSVEQVTHLETEMRQAGINGREADVPH